jgi:hypothetical protein
MTNEKKVSNGIAVAKLHQGMLYRRPMLQKRLQDQEIYREGSNDSRALCHACHGEYKPYVSA